MDKKTLNKIVNLPNYEVEEILVFNDEEIRLLMVPSINNVATCSFCKKPHINGYHSEDTVIVEDYSISGRRVFLHIKKRKYRCPEDNRIHVEDISWLKLFSRITDRYVRQINRLTAITTNQEAGWYLGINDEVVYRADKRALEEQAKEKIEPIPAGIHLSVDEVSYKKYHRYLTNVIDTDRKLIIWNAQGRKAEILDKYYQGIGKENCEKIESVAMDGARTYISSTTRYAVNALIVYDKFHLVQKLNNTIDEVRKIELAKAKKSDNEELAEMVGCKQRFILLKNKGNLTSTQANNLEKLCKINKPIYEAMLLKENFLQIYSMGDNFEEITNHILEWFIQANDSKSKPLQTLANKLYDKIDYILNWFKQKISSAISEGFNNKIKRLKRMAYGYKDIDYFRLKIHQHCGLLNPRIAT
jgi:transposase